MSSFHPGWIRLLQQPDGSPVDPSGDYSPNRLQRPPTSGCLWTICGLLIVAGLLAGCGAEPDRLITLHDKILPDLFDEQEASKRMRSNDTCRTTGLLLMIIVTGFGGPSNAQFGGRDLIPIAHPRAGSPGRVVGGI